MIAHWDEVESGRAEAGHIAGLWTDLGSAAGSKTVGVNRIRIDAGSWSTPFHRQTAEEEIFFVLDGTGVCMLEAAAFEVRVGDCVVHPPRETHSLRAGEDGLDVLDGTGVCMLEGAAFEVRVGDCVIHPPGETHSLRAGEDGLDVLAFGTRVRTEAAHLPRAGVSWLGGSWVDAGQGEHPWAREAAAGEPDLPALGPRPDTVVNLDEVDGRESPAGSSKPLARNAGADLSGLNWARLNAGCEGAPPHLHSTDEELFVVLDGDGTLELWPTPQRARAGIEYEELPVRAGNVVSRPASSGIAHGFRAGADGMTFLAYGTRRADDVCYYPRSNKLNFRGLGLIARLEDLDYNDGEPR